MGGGFRPGFTNYYTVAPAISCSPNINDAIVYAKKFNLSYQITKDEVDFKNLRMIFQCRVNPKGLKEHT